MIARIAGVPRNVAREWRTAWPRVNDARSFIRYAADAAFYRGLSFVPASERLRTIRVGDAKLTYRLQRGDIRVVREIWMEECYRPPVPISLDTVVDLGMNIGLASVWYGLHGGSRLLGVEPLASNIALARRNLAQNRVSAEFVQAAVGAEDGTARFHVDPVHSTDGQVSGTGELEVPVVSITTLLSRLDRVDLLKMDIEGAEFDVLRGDVSWLGKVNAIIIEFHNGDEHELVPIIEGHGLRYLPSGSVWWNSMDFFVRNEGVGRPRAHE